MAKKTATPVKYTNIRTAPKKARPTSKTPAKTGGKTAVKAPAKPAKVKVAAAGGPLARLKAAYGSKDKLVDTIASQLATDGDDQGTLKERLRKASNQQLLRLANVAETVKKTYGSRDKLIDALAKALDKAKDKDYLSKLGTFSLPRLYDLARAAERKVKAARAK